jgi:deoxycytidylate deaminase
MKRLFIVVLALGFICGLSNLVSAECITIQDGTLLTTDGRVISTGYDEWGYNYQAHMFNGGYCDAYRGMKLGLATRIVMVMGCWIVTMAMILILVQELG